MNLSCHEKMCLTHFWPTFPFYSPLKTPGNLWFSGIFSRYKVGNIDQKWIKETKFRDMLFHFFRSEDGRNFSRSLGSLSGFPAEIYLFKVNNVNTRTMCEIFSKLTIKTSERRHWRRSAFFIVNFEQISHTALVCPLLTYDK